MAIPALIVSGYLGSGKTTLVAHLLAEAQREGVRLAIISNEFGDTGIDRALLDAGEDGFVELDGGCVCCKLSDALGDTISTIVERVNPDRLVLETSGVALPGELLIQFWRPPIADLVSEEVVVVVVDAERLARGESEDDTFIDQIEAADLLLLNKCDLVDAEARLRGAELLAERTGGQPVIEAIQARVAPALLFPPDPELQRQARRDPAVELHAHSHERFVTQELWFEGVVDEDAVLAKVEALAAIRVKGFVRTPKGIRVLQGVGARITLSPPPRPVPDPLVGKVVVIRRDAD